MKHVPLPHQTQREHSCTVFNRIYEAALQQIAGRLKTQLFLSSYLVIPTKRVSESLQSLQGTQTFSSLINQSVIDELRYKSAFKN